MILEDGLTWQQMSMTAEDSQFIDQRKYSVAEIARFFGGVPPHAIGDVDRGTSWGSGIEQQKRCVSYPHTRSVSRKFPTGMRSRFAAAL